MAFGPIERSALAILRRHLGTWAAVAVGLRVQLGAARGEPFRDLPAAADPKERGSRDQAGPAVLLYRALRARVGEERALAITADVVEQGAVIFLGRNLGGLKRAELAALDDEARRRFVESRGERFPNATLRWDVVEPDEVRFTVTRCRLVELVAHAGHPELAPLFCRGDARFFGTIEPDVVLERPHTIAGGAPSCLFLLRWREHDPS